MTPNMRAALRVLRDGGSMTPNQIGWSMRRFGVVVPQPLSHNGRVMGPGSMIVPTLRALMKRGWIANTWRQDGRSGTAYIITEAGREALREEAAS